MKLKNKYLLKNPSSRLYQCEIPIIGLTGGIASGKSSVSEFIGKNYNISIICADKLVKKIYSKTETIKKIEAIYPESVSDNQINFKLLREQFFKGNELKQKIENIIYSQLETAFKEEIKQQKNKELLIYDIPLLFEKGMKENFDQIICIYCPREKQIERLMSRDSISRELSEKILSYQLDIEFKKQHSQFVVDNSSVFQSTQDQVKKILQELTD